MQLEGKMRICFDFEFIENGRTIEPLSVGLVRGDGLTYYAEFLDTDMSEANEWVVENVFPKLEGGDNLKTKAQIAKEIKEFAGESPIFWGYYSDYDWVALCQLYGRMIDLPEGWSMYCRDLKFLVDLMGEELPAQTEEFAHNALNDAMWIDTALQSIVDKMFED